MLSQLTALLFILPVGLACLGYEGGIPTPTAHHSNSAVIEIAAGEVFDAGWAKYDRGSGACKGSTEGDWRDAVFYLHSGATLRNAIIGKDQAEGVHCDGACTLEFVWFEDVCEDAISIVCRTTISHIDSSLSCDGDTADWSNHGDGYRKTTKRARKRG